MPEAYNEQNQLILSLLCITALIASGLLYARTGTDSDLSGGLNNTTSSNGDRAGNNMDSNIPEETIKNITKPKLVRILQPTCPPLNKDEELKGICQDFLFVKFKCKPEDVMNPAKHKIPKYYYHHAVKNNSSNETQNIIVNCIIAILLLTSLGAALLEFYRAKLSPPPDGGKKGVKAPLNRKCSLADLTVLKHHRKELVRRESILEHHNEETTNGGNTHQGGFKPAPLHRRCSFPVSFPSHEGGGGGGGFSSRRNSRKFSMTTDISRRVSMVTDSNRKLSMVTDEDIWRRSSLVGEDSSPERRHHTRLVHRH